MHFSEYGVAKKALQEFIKGISPDIGRVKAEVELAIANSEDAVDVFDWWVDWVRGFSDVSTYEEWEQWSFQVVAIVLRLVDQTDVHNWDEDTAGLASVLERMQKLIDEWFQGSDGILQVLGEECRLGDLEAAFKMTQIQQIGKSIIQHLVLTGMKISSLGRRRLANVSISGSPGKQMG